MKRLLPKSLVGQTILVLFIGLSASHAISMLIYSGDKLESMTLMGGHHMSQRIVNISHLVTESPQDWHPKIIAAVDEPTFHVSLTPESELINVEHEDWRSGIIRNYIYDNLQSEKVRSVKAQLLGDSEEIALNGSEATAEWMKTHMAQTMHGVPVHQSLRVSIQLDNKSWLNFSTAIPTPKTFFSQPALISMLLMAAAVILLSVWGVRRLTKPLNDFAQAAQRLGRDVNAPPLEEIGPIEVRRASKAFNEMQNRLRAFIGNRTRMLAAISHDLRTPITLLRLRAEMVEDEEGRRKMLSTLDEMEAMVSSTLAFAREEAKAESPSLVDVGALVESICVDMADAGLPVAFETPVKCPYECRPAALKRAITNIIENAIKYGECANAVLSSDEHYITISIDDEGLGIPDEDMENVFMPYFRVDPSRTPGAGGIGLGLSLAQAVIHAHGGEIRLENKPGKGMRATICLPH